MNGQILHLRSCQECGFKKHFLTGGTPLSKPGVNQYEVQPRVDSVVTPNIAPSLKAYDNFLNQTSTLSSYEKGLKFEKFCQTLLEAMGYEVEHTGQSGDRGVDLKAVRQQPIGRQTMVVQCKHQESVSAEVVIQILGMVNAANVNQGLVITTGSFTADAIQFAEENRTIEIIDGLQLAELVSQYID